MSILFKVDLWRVGKGLVKISWWTGLHSVTWTVMIIYTIFSLISAYFMIVNRGIFLRIVLILILRAIIIRKLLIGCGLEILKLLLRLI